MHSPIRRVSPRTFRASPHLFSDMSVLLYTRLRQGILNVRPRWRAGMNANKTSLAIFFALGTFTFAEAQVNKSNMSGVVRDSSGAVVARAEVRLTNTGTGVVRSEVTDDTGLYRFLLVDLGAYRLDVAASGFKKFSRDGIQLQAGETITS